MVAAVLVETHLMMTLLTSHSTYDVQLEGFGFHSELLCDKKKPVCSILHESNREGAWKNILRTNQKVWGYEFYIVSQKVFLFDVALHEKNHRFVKFDLF